MAVKKTVRLSSVWPQVRTLLWRYRRHLLLGFGLMLVNRLAGLVLPLSLKFLIDDVLTAGRAELITPLAAAVGGAVLVQAATSFGLAQVVSVAGQRAIAEMRRSLQAHVLRLPVSYFDSTSTGSHWMRTRTST